MFNVKDIAKCAPVIVGLALVAALAVFLYFGSRTAKVLEFKLADSVVTLSLSPGSLPDGVEANALKITEMSKDEAPLEAADGSEISTYKLEPDGLVFKKPATVSFAFEDMKKTVPMIFSISSGDEVDLLSKTSVSIDRKAGKTVVYADVGHFSEIAVSWGGIFEVEMLDIANQRVGRAFEVPVQVRKLRTTVVFRSVDTNTTREVTVLG